jgi:hypothetical protein
MLDASIPQCLVQPNSAEVTRLAQRPSPAPATATVCVGKK